MEKNNDLHIGMSRTAIEISQERIRHICAQLEQEFGAALDRVERNQLAICFRQSLLPPRRRGRKPKSAITAAVQDWNNGLRGEILWSKHIPGWENLSEWRRNEEAESLESAIRTRIRRSKQTSPNEASEPEFVLESDSARSPSKTSGKKLSSLSKLSLLDDSEIEFVER